VATSIERKAQNEAIFRDANEEIELVRDQLTEVDGKTPFFCECDDPTCREIVRLDIDEYEAVRAHPATFVIAPGHPHEVAEVVLQHETYLVVEKRGAAREVALETDPRSGDG
jgi:hypothetical protein